MALDPQTLMLLARNLQAATGTNPSPELFAQYLMGSIPGMGIDAALADARRYLGAVAPAAPAGIASPAGPLPFPFPGDAGGEVGGGAGDPTAGLQGGPSGPSLLTSDPGGFNAAMEGLNTFAGFSPSGFAGRGISSLASSAGASPGLAAALGFVGGKGVGSVAPGFSPLGWAQTLASAIHAMGTADQESLGATPNQDAFNIATATTLGPQSEPSTANQMTAFEGTQGPTETSQAFQNMVGNPAFGVGPTGVSPAGAAFMSGGPAAGSGLTGWAGVAGTGSPGFLSGGAPLGQGGGWSLANFASPSAAGATAPSSRGASSAGEAGQTGLGIEIEAGSGEGGTGIESASSPSSAALAAMESAMGGTGMGARSGFVGEGEGEGSSGNVSGQSSSSAGGGPAGGVGLTGVAGDTGGASGTGTAGAGSAGSAGDAGPGGSGTGEGGQGQQAGGPVERTRSGQGDSEPRMLEPGEFVINRQAAARFRPVLEAMNAFKSQQSLEDLLTRAKAFFDYDTRSSAVTRPRGGR